MKERIVPVHNMENSLRNRMDQGIPGVQSWSIRFVSDFCVPLLAINESVLTTRINDPLGFPHTSATYYE